MLMTPATLYKCWWPLLPSTNADDPPLPFSMLMTPSTLYKCWRPLLPSLPKYWWPPASFILFLRDVLRPLPALFTSLHRYSWRTFFVFSRREKRYTKTFAILFFGLYGTACNGQFLHSRCHGYLERWITLACSAWYIKHARICRRAWMMPDLSM